MAKNGIVTTYDDEGFPSNAVFTTPIAYTAMPIAVKNSAGRLASVQVTTTLAGSSAAITFYDNASAASGTILLVIPTGATAGTRYAVDLPAVNGIYVSEASLSAGAITVGYS
jgi:hypothetical protein